MRLILIAGIVICLIIFCSCTILFHAYIRNATMHTAIIDVYLLDKSQMATLPNKVRVANRTLNFKGNYKKYIDSTQNVTWMDTEHFKLEIKPNTTVDLSDMAGIFINSHPSEDVRVTVSTNNKVDTLLNGRNDFRYNQFHFKGRLFSPVLYYDVK